MTGEKKTFTLVELTNSIQKAIRNIYNGSYWVKTEMHKLNKTPKGHCYPELVHKENGEVVAEMRGTIWKNNFDAIRVHFEEVVKEPFRDGLILLFQVRVSFHPLYGMGLEIIDIDPHYTLGELQKEREETLKKLKEKGILNKNQYLKVPLLPKNIAIISVASSKGLSDFMTIIDTNPFGYKFNTKLFPAILNGDGAIKTIQEQLKIIHKYRAFFEVVVIVRGGGGEIGMTCYNNYELCESIATFSLPILTGIGHSTNLTVAEMIAYKSAITPTELAGFFINSFRQFDLSLIELKSKMTMEGTAILNAEKRNVLQESRVFRNASNASIIANKRLWEQAKNNLITISNQFQKEAKRNLKEEVVKVKGNWMLFYKLEFTQLKVFKEQLSNASKKFVFSQETRMQDHQLFILNTVPRAIERKRKELTQIETTIRLVHPEHLLKKGYTITYLNGKVISENNLPKQGDELITKGAFGELKSISSGVNE